MLMYLMLYRFNLFCQFVSFIYQKSNVQNIDLKKKFVLYRHVRVFLLWTSFGAFLVERRGRMLQIPDKGC